MSPSGLYRVTLERPASMRSWISWVPEALSSIRMVVGLEEIALFAHGSFEVGKVELLAQDVEQIKCVPLTPQVVQTE